MLNSELFISKENLEKTRVHRVHGLIQARASGRETAKESLQTPSKKV